jgi:hypothetical protein
MVLDRVHRPPCTIDLEPDLGERNRLTVGLRFLWMIPMVLFLLVVGFGYEVALVRRAIVPLSEIE